VAAPTIAEIKSTLKPVDAWWTVLVIDPISIRLVWVLLRIVPSASPMAVTTASLLVGAGSIAAFVTGQLILGAVLFEVAFLLDCVDGKVARLKKRTTVLGGFYDGFVNNLLHEGALAGLAAHSALAHDQLAAWSLVALLVTRMVLLDTTPSFEMAGGWEARNAAPPTSRLTRHRLLPPLTFPDKQVIVFVVGPVSGAVAVTALITGVLDVANIARKLRQGVRLLHAFDVHQAQQKAEAQAEAQAQQDAQQATTD
jgi:phosphatidylglycerophosphate synthase